MKQLHQQYLETFKEKILDEIKKLDPYDFELFCRNLLKVYDFQEVKVTQKSRDGGIDVHGKYKVGLTFINAAFQCKRWKSNTVGGKEIDQFKGAIQGKFELGFFFTTCMC